MLFETAQEQASVSPFKNRTQIWQNKSQSNQSSPSKNLRSKTMAEIAADPSPSDPMGDVDLNFNILSNDDVQFQKTLRMSNNIEPVPRRRRINVTTKWKLPNPNPPSDYRGTPTKPTSSALSALTPAPTSSEVDRRSSSPLSEPPASQHDEVPPS